MMVSSFATSFAVSCRFGVSRSDGHSGVRRVTHVLSDFRQIAGTLSARAMHSAFVLHVATAAPTATHVLVTGSHVVFLKAGPRFTHSASLRHWTAVSLTIVVHAGSTWERPATRASAASRGS